MSVCCIIKTIRISRQERFHFLTINYAKATSNSLHEILSRFMPTQKKMDAKKLNKHF